MPFWGDDHADDVTHGQRVIVPSEERLTTFCVLPMVKVSTSLLRESQAQVVTHIARATLWE